MKKIAIIFCLILGAGLSSQAQVNPRTIGLRLGVNGGTSGAEVSYQHGLGDANRLELNLGFRGYRHYGDVLITGAYHWVNNLTDGLNWFIGPGAGLGFYSWDDGVSSSSGISLSVGGQIGLEYDFGTLDVPLLVSLDSRPMFNLVGWNRGIGVGGALSVRYIF